MAPEPQPQPVASDEIEPRAITYIGGPWNGKKRADYGELQRVVEDGRLYKRVRMNCPQGDVFEVMAYFGL